MKSDNILTDELKEKIFQFLDECESDFASKPEPDFFVKAIMPSGHLSAAIVSHVKSVFSIKQSLACTAINNWILERLKKDTVE